MTMGQLLSVYYNNNMSKCKKGNISGLLVVLKFY